MSKFERYKKQPEEYIYPHKHCKRCGRFIDEAYNYCVDCYQKIKEQKEKKWKKWFKFRRKKKNQEESNQ